MFSSFENILLEIENSYMAYSDSLEPYLKYISDLQGINTIQAILIALFVEGNSDGSSVTISDIARFMDCPKVRVMKFHEDIDDLVKRKFLRKVKRKYGKESLGYVVPEDVLKAFNMDISSINTAYGWLKTEGFMFVLLIIGIYASFQGILVF